LARLARTRGVRTWRQPCRAARLERGLKALRLALLGAFSAILNAAPAAAQCVLCYTSVAGSGDRGIRVLQIGILILLVPTLTILAGLVWIAVRRRNGGGEASEMDRAWEEDAVSPNA